MSAITEYVKEVYPELKVTKETRKGVVLQGPFKDNYIQLVKVYDSGAKSEIHVMIMENTGKTGTLLMDSESSQAYNRDNWKRVVNMQLGYLRYQTHNAEELLDLFKEYEANGWTKSGNTLTKDDKSFRIYYLNNKFSLSTGTSRVQYGLFDQLVSALKEQGLYITEGFYRVNLPIMTGFCKVKSVKEGIVYYSYLTPDKGRKHGQMYKENFIKLEPERLPASVAQVEAVLVEFLYWRRRPDVSSIDLEAQWVCEDLVTELYNVNSKLQEWVSKTSTGAFTKAQMDSLVAEFIEYLKKQKPNIFKGKIISPYGK